MDTKYIDSQKLLADLQHAAVVRSGSTMLSMLVFLFLGACLAEFMGEGLIPVCLFGGPLVVMMLVTHFYCKRKVLCPYCGKSLWQCGTGNFKPRRIQIKCDECPHCHAVIF